MRLKLCLCVYFFVLFNFVNCNETRKALPETTNGTVKGINEPESTSTEQQMTVTTDNSLLAPTTIKTTEISDKTLTTEKTTKNAALPSSRSAVEANTRQMYVSSCPCSCDQPGYSSPSYSDSSPSYSSPSYSVPQQISYSQDSYYQPSVQPVQQSSYAQSDYPSQANSYAHIPSYNVPQPSYQSNYQSSYQPLDGYSLLQQNHAAQNYRPQYYRSTFNAWEDSMTEENHPEFRSYEPSPEPSSSYSDCGSNPMIGCAPTVSYVPCSSYGSPSY